ncbi:MAG: helix-turn-helix domain-containing protein [Planctomycetota bacterium]
MCGLSYFDQFHNRTYGLTTCIRAHPSDFVMPPAQLQSKLNELLALPQETEWAEFKQNNTDPQMIGEYLSALSNAAALQGKAFGYIVWGVEDSTRKIVGTTFKPRKQRALGNEDLEPWLNKLLSPRIVFRIFEFEYDGKPMVMFEIQAANTEPVAFKGRRWVVLPRMELEFTGPGVSITSSSPFHERTERTQAATFFRRPEGDDRPTPSGRQGAGQRFG